MYSNTSVKTHQPQQEELAFLNLINQAETTGKVPHNYGDIGRYKKYVNSLIEGLEQDGLPGFLAAKKAILNKEKHLASLYSTHQVDQEQAEQEEEEQQDDKRFIKDANGKQLLRLYSIGEVYKTPDPSYVISRIIEEASVSLLYGVSGTGKTFTALDIALCVAHGIPWQGRRVKQGVVWYINTEGARGLKKRLKAWYAEHPDLSPTENFKVIPWSLDMREHYKDLLYTIEQQEQKPALIIIDNFSMCTAGINQNLQEEVTPILRRINNLAQEQEIHIMIVHHTNKAGDFNGTMAFRNHVDTMIELRKEDMTAKDSAILFTCQKPRDDEPFPDIKLELKRVSLGMNPHTLEEITSCVVVSGTAPTNQERKAAETDQERKKVLELLEIHKRLSVNKWIAACKDIGISKRAFYEHIPYFKAEKLVTWEDRGNGRGIYFELAAVPVEQASLDTTVGSDD